MRILYSTVVVPMPTNENSHDISHLEKRGQNISHAPIPTETNTMQAVLRHRAY